MSKPHQKAMILMFVIQLSGADNHPQQKKIIIKHNNHKKMYVYDSTLQGSKIHGAEKNMGKCN